MNSIAGSFNDSQVTKMKKRNIATCHWYEIYREEAVNLRVPFILRKL